jgi:hypothetical protein
LVALLRCAAGLRPFPPRTLRGAIVLLGLLAVGCDGAGDECREHEPAFEVKVLLPEAVKPELVATLKVHVQAGTGFTRDKTYGIDDELDDGETSFVVHVGADAGAEGYAAEVSVTAEDKAGAALARGEEIYKATGDGCNFFTIRLSAVPPPPPCKDGETQACYSGPSGTAGKGPCKAGQKTCSESKWGDCKGEVLPTSEVCDGADNDCDGAMDEAADLTAPACAKDKGVCKGSTRRCGGGSGWLPCGTADYAAHDSAYEETEATCDQKDNDCDGRVDEELFDQNNGCWDLRARITKADLPVDATELKVLGKTVKEGEWVYGMFGLTDPHVAMDNLPCTGRKTVYKAKAWVIRRELKTATEHVVQVEGNARQDCIPKYTPLFKGEVEVNVNRWTVTAKSCPATLVGSGFCQLDSATGKASWRAGRLCAKCCACPESAAVNLEFTVIKK